MDLISRREKLMKVAISSYQKKNYEGAINLLEQFIVKYPNESTGYYYLGVSYGNTQKQQQDAVPFLAKAISLEPSEYEYYLQLASALYDLGEYEELLKLLDLTIEAFPKLSNAYNFKAYILFVIGDRKEAVALAYKGEKYPGYIFDGKTRRWDSYNIGNWTEEDDDFWAETEVSPAYYEDKSLVDNLDLFGRVSLSSKQEAKHFTKLQEFSQEIIARSEFLVDQEAKLDSKNFAVVDLLTYYKKENNKK